MRTLIAVCILLAAVSGAGAANPQAGKFYSAGDPKKAEFALTYDDGPGYITEDLLRLLARRGVKATFFVLGSAARTYPERVKLAAQGGHLLASHTDSHVLWKKAARAAGHEQKLAKELEVTAAAIEKASGVKPRLLRMPNGYDAPWVREVARRTGYTLVNWTYGTDWLKVSEENMTAGYLKALKPGAIILLHDGGGKAREKNLRLTEAILDEAARKGLKPVLLDELLGIAEKK